MITENLLIAELVEKYPELVEILLENDVHCVGCHASPVETIGEGLRGHGKSEEEVQEILKKMNEKIKEKQDEEVGVEFNISSLAADKIKAFCSKENKQALRVGVKAGGCSGYSYTYDLVEGKNDDDLVFTKEDAKVYVSKEAMNKLSGVTLDYKDSLTGAGFTVSNPNAKRVCGCGVSFN